MASLKYLRRLHNLRESTHADCTDSADFFFIHAQFQLTEAVYIANILYKMPSIIRLFPRKYFLFSNMRVLSVQP